MVKLGLLQALKKCNDRIPARLVLAIMAFMACWCVYMLRLNLSVTIIAMVEPPESKKGEVKDFGPRYDWGEEIQGDVLAAFSYGYVLTQFPGGIVSEYFGARWVVFIALLMMSIPTLLTPLASDLHWGALMAARIIIGLGGGAVYPALHSLISRWAPPEEKSKFIWALLGGTFGTVVSFPVCGLMVEYWGWPASYYAFGAFALVFTALWFVLISDSPQKHPRISDQEKAYIEEKIGATLERAEGVKSRSKLPFLKIITSLPFLALMISHYGNLWGLFFLLTLSPKFMVEILDFDIKASGGLSSLPYLARVGFGFAFSAAGDYMVKKKMFSRTIIRKIFMIFSHLLSGALMFLIGYLDNNVAWTVTVMTLCLGMNGAATVANLSNHHDLAPNFAGSLYGIMNAVGSTSGFIAPMIAGRILEYNNGLYEWRIIFIIGALFYIVTGTVFMIFGSGKIQPWNLPKEQEQPRPEQPPEEPSPEEGPTEENK